jgi:hypothetical protein
LSQTTGSDATPPTSATNSNQSGPVDTVNPNNDSSTPITTTPTPLNNLNFTTYTYGGYSVQQPDPNQFLFAFPDSTNQGQLAGSDAISLGPYVIQKMDFDAVFTAPQISAFGFDEMVIFASSDTVTYKGTEFGIRLDLSDGSIYGYIQEPNSSAPDVNFQMMKLMPNDGTIHHYSVVMNGSTVSFYIDGVNCGDLRFPSSADYSSFSFSILAVVHRFTDNWDSTGDTMVVGNFTLNNP